MLANWSPFVAGDLSVECVRAVTSRKSQKLPLFPTKHMKQNTNANKTVYLSLDTICMVLRCFNFNFQIGLGFY